MYIRLSVIIMQNEKNKQLVQDTAVQVRIYIYMSCGHWA